MDRSLTLSLAIALGLSIMPAGQALEVNGTVYFERPPSLGDVSTTRSTTLAAGSTYYVTLDVPSNAGEPLHTVTITQENGSSASQRIRFQGDRTTAFTGSRRQRGDAIAIQSAIYDEDSHSLTVTFEPAVPPGTTVTLALRPTRNPRLDGVYLLGITAYPPGDPAHGQFLGYGRLHFYQPDYRRRFWP
jgi:hypothetical protein